MKKLFFFFVYILILSGCKPDPIIEETTYSIEATCDSNGYVSPTSLIVYEGDDARITITPLTGCIVKSVEAKKGNGPYIRMSLPENNILVLENVNSDIKVKVSIEKVLEYYTLSATSSIGGTITPSGEITIEKSTSRNYTLASDDNYFIDSLLIDEKNMQVPALASTYTFSYTANDALHHTIRVVYRQKKVYTIKTICDEYSTYSGITSVYEGSSTMLQGLAKELCSLVNVKVDGETITGNSYTFTNVNSNHTFEVSSKREPEWYLCRGTWSLDSSYVNNLKFIDGGVEKFKYYSNGTFDKIVNGYTFNLPYSLDKTTNPITMKLPASQSSCKLIVLNETTMIKLYEETVDNEYRKTTAFFHNTGTR